MKSYIYNILNIKVIWKKELCFEFISHDFLSIQIIYSNKNFINIKDNIEMKKRLKILDLIILMTIFEVLI